MYVQMKIAGPVPYKLKSLPFILFLNRTFSFFMDFVMIDAPTFLFD